MTPSLDISKLSLSKQEAVFESGMNSDGLVACVAAAYLQF